MSDRPSPPSLAAAVGRACRAVVVALLSGWLTGRDYDEVEARLIRRPVAEQAMLVGLVLAVLFALALVAAQGGLITMAAYLLAVILLAR